MAYESRGKPLSERRASILNVDAPDLTSGSMASKTASWTASTVLATLEALAQPLTPGVRDRANAVLTTSSSATVR
ncbi:MAG: hypothetical protein CVV51_07925 [Spirochaetae bacterium HGW-Spirochaetae-7]|nr:MAG: hypothetical protein CVV51_07925 [Spirochaetae bacterium HGW-Spirochaetae-7]